MANRASGGGVPRDGAVRESPDSQSCDDGGGDCQRCCLANPNRSACQRWDAGRRVPTLLSSGERQVAGGLEPRVGFSFSDAPPHDPLDGGGHERGGALDRRARSSCRMALSVSTWDWRSNARLPVSISNRIAPSAKMSARSSAGRPRACSGAMFPPSPITVCADVRSGVVIVRPSGVGPGASAWRCRSRESSPARRG